jgi:hypothetical protein
MTILDRNLALDTSTTMLQQILDEQKQDDFPVDVVIIDPRAKAIVGSENEEVVIKAFCDNIDVILKNNPGLSIIIVTHMGKDPSKGAIGHSRYLGWLDTNIDIVKDARKTCNKELHISGRDAEKTNISLNFRYPLHEVIAVEVQERKQKVSAAANLITSLLASGEMEEQEVRRLARTAGHSDYAIWTALRELKQTHEIESIQSTGSGNRKLLRLTSKDKSP